MLIIQKEVILPKLHDNRLFEQIFDIRSYSCKFAVQTSFLWTD